MVDNLVDQFNILHIGDDNDASSSNAQVIIPQCDQMCSQAEMLFRERNGLLHRLELIDYDRWNEYRVKFGRSLSSSSSAKKAAAVVSSSNHYDDDDHKCMFTNHTKAVKQFKRSSAGQTDLLCSTELRTPLALITTVDHLLSDNVCKQMMANNTKINIQHFILYYEFVFDRLRSIRQDMVLVRLRDIDVMIYILERCVEFYVYSHYLWLKWIQQQQSSSSSSLDQKTILNTSFDVHLNHKHLTECFHLLLQCYDTTTQEYSVGEDSVQPIKTNFVKQKSRRRPLFEAAHLIYNIEMNRITAFERYQMLMRTNNTSNNVNLIHCVELRIAFKILCQHLYGNYHRCLRLVRSLSSSPSMTLVQTIFAISNLASFHSRYLRNICHAFRSPIGATIPLCIIREWLCMQAYDTQSCAEYLRQLCTHFGIQINNSSSKLSSSSIDYFNFDNNDDQTEVKLNDQVDHQAMICIPKKLPSSTELWQSPVQLYPYGWLPPLSKQSQHPNLLPPFVFQLERTNLN